MRTTALLIALLLLAQSSWLVAFSTKEGIGVMTLIALAVALAPIVVLAGWYFLVRRRKGKTLLMLAGGCVLLGIMEAVLPVSPVKTSLVTAFQKRSLKEVEVRGVRDEPFLSLRGNSVGVRVTFEALFPRGGKLSLSPTLYPEEERFRHWQVSMGHFAGYGIIPEPERDSSGGMRFKAGTVYRVTADFLPTFLFLASRKERGLDAGTLCLSLEESPDPTRQGLREILASAGGTRYLLEVAGKGNTYFLAPRVLYSGYTTEVYSPKTFYESALGEGAEPCPWL